MTVDRWLQMALADAEGRGRYELTPLLRTLAQATHSLRAADVLCQEPVPQNAAAVDAPRRTAANHGE
jgi:hypothetical protein